MIWFLLACGTDDVHFWERPFRTSEEGHFRWEDYSRSGPGENGGTHFSLLYIDGERLNIPTGYVRMVGEVNRELDAVPLIVVYRGRGAVWMLQLKDGKDHWTHLCDGRSSMSAWRGNYFHADGCDRVYDASEQKVYADPHPYQHPKEIEWGTAEWYSWTKAQGPVGIPPYRPPWARP